MRGKRLEHAICGICQEGVVMMGKAELWRRADGQNTYTIVGRMS